MNSLPATLAAGSWSVSDLPLEPNVTNVIVATALDDAGRSATATVTVMVRTSGPELLITEPQDGSSTSRSRIDVAGVLLGGPQASADGVVTVNGITSAIASDGAFRALDVPLSDGLNTLTAEATDPEGRTGTATVHVTTDTTAPLIAITVDGQPLAEGATFGQPITLHVEVSDSVGQPLPPEVRLNGALQPASGPGLDIPVSTDGGYLVAVIASDPAGNQARREASFSLDLGGCDISHLDPAPGSFIAAPAVTIRGESAGARSVSIEVPVAGGDPLVYAARLADGTFLAGDVPLPALGDLTLEITCTDRGGGTHSEALPLHRLADGEGPVVTITAPVFGALIPTRTTTVTGTVSDSGVSLTLSGAPVDVVSQPDGSGTFSAEQALSEGPNVVVAQALDQAGRGGSARIVVFRDTKAPSVAISSPADGAYVGIDASGVATVTVTGKVDLDDEPNLLSVTVSTPQGQVTPAADPDTGVFSAEVTLDAAIPPESLQTITVVAADSLGHSTTVETHLHLDPTGPALALTAPEDLGIWSESSPAPGPCRRHRLGDRRGRGHRRQRREPAAARAALDPIRRPPRDRDRRRPRPAGE